MRVLIYGVNTENKGAQLLLAAAAGRLRALGHVPVVSSRDVRARTRRDYGAKGIFSVERLGFFRSIGLDWLPKSLAHELPVAGDGAFDYVLDASGFSLTDAWGMSPVTSRLSRLARWTQRGIGFSLLPQAFGPFERPDVAKGVGKIFDYADQVWARDPSSQQFAQTVAPQAAVRVSPDITIALDTTASPVAAGSVLLVPNWNLAKRSGADGYEAYVASLTTIANAIRASGREVVGLCHEGMQDLSIINEVASRVGGMRVLNPETGTECKRIIAGADFLIAGRYHALVSALSSGVPVVGHSWSHKYQALMEDFGVENGLAQATVPSETIERMTSLDLTAERERLRTVGGEVVARVDSMWREIEAALSGRG